MNKQSAKNLAISALVAGTITTMLYGAGVYFFKTHFFPFTSLEGVGVGLYTAEQADEAVKAVSAVDSMHIESRTGEEILDLSYADTHRVFESSAALIEAQDLYHWPALLRDPRDFYLDYHLSYDEDSLDEAIDSLSVFDDVNVRAPEDSRVEFSETEGRYVVTDESEGASPDEEKVREAVKSALASNETFVDLEDAAVYAVPDLRSDDEGLLSLRDMLNSFGVKTVEIDLGAGSFESIDGYDIIGMLTDDGTVSEEAVRDLVSSFAERYNTYQSGEKREITSHNGEKKTVRAYYGWKLNEDKTFNALYELLCSLTARASGDEDTADTEVAEEEPSDGRLGTAGVSCIWTKQAASHEGNDFGDTYVEVDMGEQTVYVYVSGECVMQSACVTGKMSEDRQTPEVLSSIVAKQRNKVLTGYNPDGSISYESFVNYWMPFYGGVGLHDATWRGSFGGSIYKSNGSHGCVNLPKSFAAELYSIAYVGMPVFCYY